MTAAIEAKAAALAEARRTGVSLSAWPDDVPVASAADAYAIQARTVALSGEAIAGWKVALPPGGAPLWAPMLAADVRPSPAQWPAGEVLIEAEVAFRARRPLAGSAPYARGDLMDAFEAIPSMEIISSRFAADRAPLDMLADRMANGGFVYGDGLAAWQHLPLDRIGVQVLLDGAVVVDQAGGHVLGDPFAGVLWLVNHLAAHGGLQAGQIVTTGTYSGVTRVGPGQLVEIRFLELGSARVFIAGA